MTKINWSYDSKGSHDPRGQFLRDLIDFLVYKIKEYNIDIEIEDAFWDGPDLDGIIYYEINAKLNCQLEKSDRYVFTQFALDAINEFLDESKHLMKDGIPQFDVGTQIIGDDSVKFKIYVEK